jgi:hypothetical protein
MYVLKLIFNIRLKKVISLDSITVIGLIKIIPKMNKARNIKVKLEKHFY